MPCGFVFFFNDTATTEIYTLSLHDALPIYRGDQRALAVALRLALDHGRDDHDVVLRELPALGEAEVDPAHVVAEGVRSEEHTSELQSRQYLVCRLLLEKKNTTPDHDGVPAR